MRAARNQGHTRFRASGDRCVGDRSAVETERAISRALRQRGFQGRPQGGGGRSSTNLSGTMSPRAHRRRFKRRAPFGAHTELMTMTESHLEDLAAGETLSRRSLVAGATFFGAAMAAIGGVARAE